MSPDQLRAVLVPSLASLFLILWLCAFAPLRPAAAGIHLHIYPLHPEGEVSYQCNASSIVLYLARDGRMRINETQIPPAELTARLNEVFDYRVVRRAYVVAASDVSYGQFVDYLNRIAATEPKLDVVLLSGDLRREAEHEQTFNGLCGFFPPPILIHSWIYRSDH
jgi:hypothetical protein